ncbi:pyridoxal phosphate-dependent transferase [Coprinopsis sp. MPI-PUGE-AT-0042]|nr:pyridoxal phosphate-dependent transferase [Coprinopsis sp. MPI-PUGE-AT-0042]
MHNALWSNLEAALTSHEKRQIRQRLPDPSHLISSAASPPKIIDFTSNNYLSLSPHLCQTFLQAPSSPGLLGSGTSRLLINTPTHADFEARLETFFNAPQVLLFNSGFDANVRLFSAVLQKGDAIVYDEYIHASCTSSEPHLSHRCSIPSPCLRRRATELRLASARFPPISRVPEHSRASGPDPKPSVIRETFGIDFGPDIHPFRFLIRSDPLVPSAPDPFLSIAPDSETLRPLY